MSIRCIGKKARTTDALRLTRRMLTERKSGYITKREKKRSVDQFRTSPIIGACIADFIIRRLPMKETAIYTLSINKYLIITFTSS